MYEQVAERRLPQAQEVTSLIAFGGMGIEGTDWLIIGAAWMLGTFGGGWMLAWLYKRLHPSLAFYKLWAFWSMLLGAIVALLFALGAVRM